MRRILTGLKTVPGMIGAACLTALAAWGVPTLVPRLFESVSGRNPLAIGVQSNSAAIDTFEDLPHRAVLPANARVTEGLGPGCRGFFDFVRRERGAAAGESRIRFTLRGRDDEPVLVTNARIEVLRRAAPMRGIPIECPTGGAADIRALVADLDRPDPAAVYVENGRRKPLGATVSKGEVVI